MVLTGRQAVTGRWDNENRNALDVFDLHFGRLVSILLAWRAQAGYRRSDCQTPD